MQTVTVKTPCGDVCGRREAGIDHYKGIPYAKALRFELPQIITHYDCTVDAVDERYSFPQFAAYRDDTLDFYYKEFRSGYTFRYDEELLRLNITAPENAENLPVLVYIHGGGHETGTPNELPYGPSTAYPERGIVFVSIEYRLNVFNLFRSGNYGLHDQLAAIKWVKANIAAFGGDEDRITIAGQSAGAMSVMDLCYCEELKGLVSGAIMFSGGGIVPKLSAPWTKEQSAPFWDAIRDAAGADNDEELKKIPADKLWNAWYDHSRSNYNMHAVQPGIDGYIIPDIPQKLAKKGKIADIPVMIGVTSQDFMPVILYEMARSYALYNEKNGRSKVWCYMFDKTLPGNNYKAFHEADLWYVFDTMEHSARPFDEKDRELAALMADHIANFIKNGDPNGQNLPCWEPVTRKQQGFRHFDGISSGYIYPAKCRYKMLKTMLWDKGPM